MASLWICLTLLYALQSSVSSDEVVSLNCSETVEVEAGETVTLNCIIKFNVNEKNCTVQSFDWKSANGTSMCNSTLTEDNCTIDNLNNVSLTISSVTKEENFTVEIQSNCGMDESSIKVKLIGPRHSKDKIGNGENISLPLSVVFGVFAAAIVVAILYKICRTDRCRKIMKHANGHGSYSSPLQAV